MFALLAQVTPTTVPGLPTEAVAPVTPAAPAPELFDLPIGAALLLLLILGLIRYGLKTPGPQRKAGVWGGIIGWISYPVIVGATRGAAPVGAQPDGVPVIGTWAGGATDKVINPPIPHPGWFWLTDGWITAIQWACYIVPVVLVGYWYLHRLWDVPFTPSQWKRRQKAPAQPGGGRRGQAGGRGGVADDWPVAS